MAASRRKPIDRDTEWSTRQFAAEIGVTPQAVLKAVNGGEMPAGTFRVRSSRGRKTYAFGKSAFAWWKANRGEKNNVSGHGGRREEGEPRGTSHQPSGKKGEEKDGGETFEARRRAGELLLRDIIDGHGNVDRALVPRLSTPELKRYVGMQQGLNRELERKVREGQLLERTAAMREWTRRCAAAAAEMQQMAARAADAARARLGLNNEQARIVREILDGETARAMAQLGGREEGTSH